MTRKVEVVPYDVNWARLFENEASLLESILGENVIAIHHIGSTSIPGISAKPIIDILVEVDDIARVDQCNNLMVHSGYIPRGEYGIAGRRYFVKADEEKHTHHVHIFQTGNPEVQRHLTFRDYMIAHPDEAQAYSQLKTQLSNQYPEDIEGYMDGKNDFIQEIDRKASIWNESQRR